MLVFTVCQCLRTPLGGSRKTKGYIKSLCNFGTNFIYKQKSPLHYFVNVHGDLAREARNLNHVFKMSMLTYPEGLAVCLGSSLHLHSHFVYVSSESFDQRFTVVEYLIPDRGVAVRASPASLGCVLE